MTVTTRHPAKDQVALASATTTGFAPSAGEVTQAQAVQLETDRIVWSGPTIEPS
jgi:hypothetical protein